VQLRYNFRLDPTPGQMRELARAFGCARVVFNDGLAARKAAYASGLPYPKTAELSRALITEAKQTPERAWLSEVSAVVLQQALRDLDAAYKNLFDSASGTRKGRRIAAPRFRSRKDNRQAVRFTANARFKITAGGRLSLPKIGDIAVRWSRDLPSAPSSVTVVKDPSGRYFASFAVQTDPAADLARFPSGPDDVYAETGIDLGLTHFVVRDNGQKIDAPRFLRKAERRLKKLQQSLARKQKGSNNRKKAVVKVAKAHAKVADSRRDFHHKLSTQIIGENQAVYVEDLAVAGLGRTRLAKSVHDAGWAAFVDMLEYKAARYGRVFAKIDWFAPTSQTCSACGVKDGPKPLDVREWACPACRRVHDRDINAARNILILGRQVAAGRAETLNACGAQARRGPVPAPRSETGTRPGELASAKPAPTGAEGIPSP
jgi:putative transposase